MLARLVLKTDERSPARSNKTRPMWGCCGQHRSTSGSAAALVLVQAARLPPGPTRNAAEPTARPNAAATSADTDENGRVCVGGLGPYALLLETTSEQQRAAAVHHSHVHRVHHVRGGADDVSGLLIAALTASTHTPIGRGSEDLGCKHLPFDGSQRSCCWLADAAAMPTAVGLTSMQLPPVAT